MKLRVSIANNFRRRQSSLSAPTSSPVSIPSYPIRKLLFLLLLFIFQFTCHFLLLPPLLFISAQLQQPQQPQQPQWQQQQRSCANSGRFMQAYCLADYNCNAGRLVDLTDPTQRQVCIRGWCCSQTATPKEQVNVFLQQDRYCPVATFNVELQCQSTEDCVRSGGVARFPVPILECGGQGYCCTSQRYRKPLQFGDLCLNGGSALGQQCQMAVDCRRADTVNRVGQQLGPLCIDNQCCTQRATGDGGGGQFDPNVGPPNPNVGEQQSLCTNGGVFTGKYCSGLDDSECGSLYQMAWTAVCLQGRCCTNPLGNGGIQADDFDRGQAICARLLLQYVRNHCSSPAHCGFPSSAFSCISGYCCSRSAGAGGGAGQGGTWDDGGGGWNVGGQVPAQNPANYCPVNGRFIRFLGRFCTLDDDCPTSFDARTQRRLLSRCLGQACCGEQQTATAGGGSAGGQWDTEVGIGTGGGGGGWGGGVIGTGNAGIGGGQNRVLPRRYVQGYCFDGSPSSRQCFSKRDCQAQENCVNNMCCTTSGDQDQYACGGLQSIGLCLANGVCTRGECVSSNVCCECPYGQPQLDVNNCNSNGMCKPGYVCNRRSGFCCPQCAGESLPFGSCYLGRCAVGFACHPGNICCEGSPNELPIG